LYIIASISNRGSKYFWALKAPDKNIGNSSNNFPAELTIEISAKLVEDEEIRSIVWASHSSLFKE
jgi:hypothetical protein